MWCLPPSKGGAVLALGSFALSTRREPLVLKDAVCHHDHLTELSQLTLLQRVLVTLRSSSPFKPTPSQCFTVNPSLRRQKTGRTCVVHWFVGFILFRREALAWVPFFCMKCANYILPLSVDKKDLVVVDNDNEMYVQGVEQSVFLHRVCLSGLLFPSQGCDYC